VLAGGHELILDAGTGVIALGRELHRRQASSPLTAALLFSHLHYDHILGLPFFEPLYHPESSLHLAGPRLAGQSFAHSLRAAFTSPYFPVDLGDVPSACRFSTLEAGATLEWYQDQPSPVLRGADGSEGDESRSERDGSERAKSRSERDENEHAGQHEVLRVACLYTTAHPRDGCLVFRIEYAGRSVVYATDVEGGTENDKALASFVRGADVLIHDAQYTEEDYQASKRGFGHSTLQMATATARAADVKQLLLFHHDPEHDDATLEKLCQQACLQFPETSIAYEGLEVKLL
jgi:ribonuclease BN (tRNA processing enzyme)